MWNLCMIKDIKQNQKRFMHSEGGQCKEQKAFHYMFTLTK